MDFNQVELIKALQDVQVAAIKKSSGILDAFGRIRTSQPETVFESSLLWDKDPLIWAEKITDNSTNATSTHSTADAGVTMHVESDGAGSDDTIVRQTRTHYAYQPLKSQRVAFTGIMNTGGAVAGVNAKMGVFTANDGLYWELDGTTLQVNKRKGGSDGTPITQANFNLDKLDGTGASGYTLDVSKEQIYFIEFEWLGVGDIWFGVFRDGEAVYAHQIKHANSLTAVYMSTPNLPLRYEITTTSATNDGNMVQTCGSIQSEGGMTEHGIDFGESTVTASPAPVQANTAGTIYAICGIRLRSTHLDANVFFEDFNVLNTTANVDCSYFMAVNPTLATDLTWAGVTNSAVEFGSPSTASPSPNTVTADWTARWGHDLVLGAAKGGHGGHGGQPSLLMLGADVDGTPDEFILCARPISANADIYGAMDWREQR